MLKIWYILAVLFCLNINTSLCLNNGLALTPPMGWLSWQRYACNVDCQNYPDECINDRLYMEMADRLASDGFKEAGYDYVNIDDCWPEKKRDPITHRLIPDHKRFPHGIKALAQYVHSKGLKMGIYGDVGTLTCGGYPGSEAPNGSTYYSIDATTFAEWGIDSLKLDGCYTKEADYPKLYPEMEIALNSSHRPIVYACSWPAYLIGKHPDYDRIAKYCNYWRNFDDIEDSWTSVHSIIDFYAKNQDLYSKYHGPGQWNDPDMLIIGNFGLSLEQSKAQMAIWAIWSAPLLMSNDLRRLREEHKKILLNKHIIEVNQDKHGIMGKRVFKEGAFEGWVKPINPIVNGTYSYAIVYMSHQTLGVPRIHSKSLSSLIPNASHVPMYYVYDLFEDAKLISKLGFNDKLTLKVNGSGGVRMVKITPVFNH